MEQNVTEPKFPHVFLEMHIAFLLRSHPSRYIDTTIRGVTHATEPTLSNLFVFGQQIFIDRPPLNNGVSSRMRTT